MLTQCVEELAGHGELTSPHAHLDTRPGRAMKVAPAGREQAEPTGNARDPPPIARTVRHVVRLDPGEALARERRHQRLESPRTVAGHIEGMCQHRDPPGRADPRDRVSRRRNHLGNERGPTRTEEAVECVVDAATGSELDERVRHVGAPDAAAPGDPEDVSRGQIDTQGAQPLDHLRNPVFPCFTNPRELGNELGMLDIEAVAEDVNVDALRLGGDFYAAKEVDPPRPRLRLGFREATGGVVIRQGEGRHPDPVRTPHDLGRRAGPVGHGAVGVQVADRSTHERSLGERPGARLSAYCR